MATGSTPISSFLPIPSAVPQPTTGSEIHAVEVEHVGGFSIKSVYQAFEQGRGANYSWVMFLASDEDAAEWKAHVGPNRPEVPLGSSSSLAAKQRVIWVATERGVGLVVMRDADARTSWHEIVAPQRKRTSDIPDDDLHLLTKASGLTIERLHDRSLQVPESDRDPQAPAPLRDP